MLGAGVLSMAYAFANAGLWLGAISYPLLGVLCFFTCVMLVKVVAPCLFFLKNKTVQKRSKAEK